jgi:hypothetical protein
MIPGARVVARYEREAAFREGTVPHSHQGGAEMAKKKDKKKDKKSKKGKKK